MDQHEPMMEARCDLIDRVCALRDPVPGVGHQIEHGLGDQVRRDADCCFLAAQYPCPAPCVAEHPAMQLVEKARIEDRPLVATIPEPVYSQGDIGLLPRIQLTSVR